MFRLRSELEKVLAVAETGKIVAAAHRLGITQPALTRAIARLETRFGAPLFERLPTGVRPTALGAEAAAQARRLLRAFEDAEDRIGGALAGRSGCIRATAGALWMQAVLPEAVGRFREAFPGIELRLRSAGRAEGLRLLEAGDSDLHCGGIDGRERLPGHLRREPLPAVTYAPVAADVGQALSVRVESGGASATSAPSAPVWPAPANPALAAGEEELLSAVLTLGSWDGFPARIAGYSRALDASFGEMDGTAFEDGDTRHAVDFLVVNENGQFALATGATGPDAAGLAAYWNGHRIAQFEVKTLEEGLRILVGRTPQSEAAYMRYMDGVSDGVRVAVSLRRARAAEQVPATPDDGAPGDLTASFAAAPPDEHDGTSPFTFRIAFSENLDGYSYRTLRDSSLTVTQGGVRLVPTKVKRVYPNDPARANTAWTVEVTPQSKEDITIELGPGPACGEPAAMCTADGKALSNAISSTVQGPPGLSVADATVQEAPGAVLEFAVICRARAGLPGSGWRRPARKRLKHGVWHLC